MSIDVSIRHDHYVHSHDACGAAGNSSPEMDAALAALQARVAIVDDLVPDA